MGLVRLRIREFAAERAGQSRRLLSVLELVTARQGLRSPGLATVDVTAPISWRGRLMF